MESMHGEPGNLYVCGIFRAQGARLEWRLIILLNHATVSSMKRGMTPDLVIGACVLIALTFIVFWLSDKDG